MIDKKYKAFISYSHADIKFGCWLQRKIENYKIPNKLREKYPHLPKDLKRSIFRDEEELSSSATLPDKLTEALDASEFLIVIASPYSATSKWVNKEIGYFKEHHGNAQVLAIIKEGEPYAKEGQLESFPPALIDDGAEPIAGDARRVKGQKRAVLKLIAGLLQVDFADLWEREKKEKRKRVLWSGLILGLFVLLSFYALSQFKGNVVNEELIKIEKEIGEIEYELRHTVVAEDRAITLNEALIRLKEDKLSKEVSLESLGRMESSIGKKANKGYREKGADEAIAILTSKENKVKQEQNRKELAYTPMTLAALYIEKHNFKKAEEEYEKASQLFFSFENIQEYAKFVRKQREPKKAIVLYERLEKANLRLFEKMRVLSNLALAYDDNNQLKKSEKTYEKVLKLHQKKPNLLPEGFALSLDNMGKLYLKTNRIDEAIVHYKKALKIMESLEPKSSVEYQRDRFAILNDLANAYKEMNAFQKAENHYEKALGLSRGLVKDNSSKYRGDLALILFNLGSMYHVNKKFDLSKATFSESLRLTKQLAKENPAVYKEELAHRLYFASGRYLLSGQIEKSEALLKESLMLSEELFSKNSNLYASLFSSVLYQKGSRMGFANKPKEALVFYEKALKTIEELKSSSPDLFQEQSGEIYLNLSSLYYPRLFKPKKAEACILKALNFYTLLAKKHPQKFNKKLADTLVALAGFYLLQNKVDKAEENYLKSVEIYRALAKQNPKQYNEALVTTLMALADFYKTTKALKKSKNILEEALALQRKIVKKHPLLLARIQLSQVLWSFSLLYLENLQELKKVEIFMLESIDISRLVAKENPSPIFLQVFSQHLNALSLLYRQTKELEKAEDILLKSLKPNKKLLKLDAKIYKIDLAGNFNDLASLYKRTKRLKKAKKYYLKALDLFNEIDDDILFKRLIVEGAKSNIFQALAEFEQKENNRSKAEAYYLSSLKISREVVKMVGDNKLAFGEHLFKLQKSGLAYDLIDLSRFYVDQGKRAKAKEYYLEGLDLAFSLLGKGDVEYCINYAVNVNLGVTSLGLPLSSLKDAKKRLEAFKGEKRVDSLIGYIDDVLLSDKE